MNPKHLSKFAVITIANTISIFLSCQKLDLSDVTKCNVETIALVNATIINVEVDIIDLSPAAHPDYGICYSDYNQTPTIADNKISMGNISDLKKYKKDIENLSPGTKYYFRGYVMNGAEAKYSFNTKDITTPFLPLATTVAATNITSISATLNATINAQNTIVTLSFEYGTSTSYGSTTNATPATIAGNIASSVSANITGLTASTLYHFRLKSVSTGGTTYSSDLIFTTTSIPSPTASTNAATNVSITTVTLNGSVNANGQTTSVTFEYGTTKSYGNITNAASGAVIGNTATNVSADILGLTAGTLYHFRVKAVSIGGITYGSDLSFTTMQAPNATTLAATNVTPISASLNGTVNANGQSTTVTFEYGITTGYGSSANATPGTVTGSTATGVSANITGLTASTLYHFRVKAVSGTSTIYGSDLSLTTNAPDPATITDIDGNVYNTIRIGSQLWMKENLKTTRYKNSELIGTTDPPTLNLNGTTTKFQWAYNGDEGNVSTYGRLYTFNAATDSRGICPAGWHVPTDAEWTITENYIISVGYNFDGSISGNKIAKAMASTTNWSTSNDIGTVGNTDYPLQRNRSGFSALPGGIRSFEGPFSQIGTNGAWWSSGCISDCMIKIGREIDYSGYDLRFVNRVSLDAGCSVRCIKD